MEGTSIYPHAYAESGRLMGSADISAICRYFSTLPTFQQPDPERCSYRLLVSTDCCRTGGPTPSRSPSPCKLWPSVISCCPSSMRRLHRMGRRKCEKCCSSQTRESLEPF